MRSTHPENLVKVSELNLESKTTHDLRRGRWNAAKDDMKLFLALQLFLGFGRDDDLGGANIFDLHGVGPGHVHFATG